MNAEFIFDLESPDIKYLIEKDSKLAKVIKTVGKISYTIDSNPYLFLVDTIIGQMLSNKVADVISKRFRLLCADDISPVKVSQLNQQDLRSIGLSNKKAESILALSHYVIENPDFFEKIALMDNNEVIKTITSLKGLGNWSAKMYLIFVLNRFDVLPYEDGAFLQVYKHIYETEEIKPSSIVKQLACWSPYSTIAARYMYRYLDEGYVAKRMGE